MATVSKAAWPVWVTVLGTVGAMLRGFLVSADGSDRVRYAGTILQLLGLGTVAVGLSQGRRLFGRPSILQKVAAWLRELAAVFVVREPVVVQVSAAGAATSTGKARVVLKAGADASLEHRLTVLEQNVDRLREEMYENATETEKELGLIRETMSREQREREEASLRVARQMENMAVGGLHLEMVGLTWLVLGVIGTSIPDGVVRWTCGFL